MKARCRRGHDNDKSNKRSCVFPAVMHCVSECEWMCLEEIRLYAPTQLYINESHHPINHPLASHTHIPLLECSSGFQTGHFHLR